VAIAAQVEAAGAERIVLGLPLDPAGEEGPAALRARAFADKLHAALAVPVDLIDESFSTVEAEVPLLAADVSQRAAQAGGGQAGRRGNFAALAGFAPSGDGTMTQPLRRALLVFLLTTAIGGGVLVAVIARSCATQTPQPVRRAGRWTWRSPRARVRAKSPSCWQPRACWGTPATFACTRASAGSPRTFAPVTIAWRRRSRRASWWN